MEEKIHKEMVTMPNETVMSFEKCMDNLLYTRDIGLYLDTLFALRNKYLIIICVKDTTEGQAPEEVFMKIHALGFSNLNKEHWRTYIGVINKGKVIFDARGEKVEAPIEYSGDIDDTHLLIKSEAHLTGAAKIIINCEDYSLNSRGLNIVIFDHAAKAVIDSSTYDTVFSKPTFYHKNLDMTDLCFDRHFYIKPQYRETWKLSYSRSYFSGRKLDVTEIEDGFILPAKRIGKKFCGGVLNNNMEFVAGHLFYSHQAHLCERFVMEGYNFEKTETEEIDETVVFGGIIFDHLGHLISESFAERIWWVLKNPKSDLRIAFINIWGDGEAKFFKDFLDLLGISEDRLINVNKPTKFKKILVPDQSDIPYIWNINYEYTQEFVDVFDKIRSRLTPTKKRKIYLTKSQSRRNNIVGESFFIDFYKKKGFEIIDPEDYSLQEKANMMYNAEEIVSQAGTNLHFLVFCQPDVKVTMFTRVSKDPLSFQSMLNKVAHIDINNIYYIDTSLEFLFIQGSFGVCWMGVTKEFLQFVKYRYNEELNIFPEQYLKEHLFDYLNKCIEHFNKPEYFNWIKNQKMLTVLQNMSYVFTGKNFDTSKLDLSTIESNLQNQVKDLNAQKNILTSQVNILTEENKALVSDMEAKTFALIASDRKTEELELKCAELKNKLVEIEHSRSWRITKPLRSIMWFFRRAFGKKEQNS